MMRRFMAKAEEVTQVMYDRFPYSPMPRGGFPTEEIEKHPLLRHLPANLPVGRIVVVAVAAFVGFCVICVIATIAAATSLTARSNTYAEASSGHSLRIPESKGANRTLNVVTSLSRPDGQPPQQDAGRCCNSPTAECLSCKADVPVARFCLRRGGGAVEGCEGFCGLNEDSFNYPGGDLRSMRQSTAQECCMACRQDRDCTSWTWGKDEQREDYKVCYLKNQTELRREPSDSYISGLPGQDSLTFQIRAEKRSPPGCLDVRSVQRGQRGIANCSVEAAAYQTWFYDRETSQIRSKHPGEMPTASTTDDLVVDLEEAGEDEDEDKAGLCLDAQKPDQGGSEVFLQKCSISSMSQRWVFDSVTGLVENAFGLCLEASAEQGSDAVRMQLCKPESEQQEWIFSAGSSAHLLDSVGGPNATHTTSTSSLTVTSTSTSSQTSSTATATGTRSSTTSTGTRTTTLVTTTTDVKVGIASLFCYSVMLPWGYEPDLLRMQISERRSIFACEDFVVYSSVALDLGSGYTTQRIDTDLHCPLGGRYHTALNTPIFLKIWNQVIADGRFRFHEWTVKADPDCVFLPSRLRDIVRIAILSTNVEKGNGIFLNNCRFGLHGPLEVVSRRALDAYGRNSEQCKQPPQEDVYLQHCLLTLGVVQMNQFNLLAEAACKSPDWQTCHGPESAFHPFKSLDAYRDCQSEAERNGTWSKKDVKAEKATADTIGSDPATAKLEIPLLA